MQKGSSTKFHAKLCKFSGGKSGLIYFSGRSATPALSTFTYAKEDTQQAEGSAVAIGGRRKTVPCGRHFTKLDHRHDMEKKLT